MPLVVSLFLSMAVCLTSSDGHQGAHVVLPAAAISPREPVDSFYVCVCVKQHVGRARDSERECIDRRRQLLCSAHLWGTMDECVRRCREKVK